MEPSEKQIENVILQWLNLQPGAYAFKYAVSGVWDPVKKIFRKAGQGVAIGGADIIGVYHGRFLALEVKTPRSFKKFFNSPGDHEVRQQTFLNRVRSAGGIAEVVCSLDMVISVINREVSNAPHG